MTRNFSQAVGILRHEAAMILRRKSRWLVYGFLYLLHGSLLVYSWSKGTATVVRDDQVWAQAGELIFQFNIFMTLVAGISAADGLERDTRTGVHELQRSAPLRRWPYIVGKYLGALAAHLVPYLLWVIVFGSALVGFRLAPVRLLPALLVAFAAMAVPAYAFVIAFSLACPLVIPLRVYQILFTGYWFWGNYLNPKVFPTLNGTLLTANGRYVCEAFFGGFQRSSRTVPSTSTEAWLNLAVLAACVAAVIVVSERLMAWRDRRA